MEPETERRNKTGHSRLAFREFSGYLLHPEWCEHGLLSIRHSAQVEPWRDGDLHFHQASEEYYLLLQGQLLIFLDGWALDLRAGEMLLVKPGVAHAVLGGAGRIEHFGFRAPARNDRSSLGPPPTSIPSVLYADQRELAGDWGCRVDLHQPANQNCWLFGLGKARFHSSDFLFANLNFPTMSEANAGLGTRHRLHLHAHSWEYYAVLEGTKTLQVEAEEVTLQPGELLVVPPGVRHALLRRQAPYRGFTFRVPLLEDKVEF